MPLFFRIGHIICHILQHLCMMDYDSDQEEPFHGFIPESSKIENENLPPPINTRLCQPTSPNRYCSSSGFVESSSSNIEIDSTPSPVNTIVCQPTSPNPRRMSDDINYEWDNIQYDNELPPNFLQDNFPGDEKACEPTYLNEQVFYPEEIGWGILHNPKFLRTASVLKRRGNCKFNTFLFE